MASPYSSSVSNPRSANAQERERIREAQGRMAANPCITFSGIPTVRNLATWIDKAYWRLSEVKNMNIFCGPKPDF